jgi:hypothetical protein
MGDLHGDTLQRLGAACGSPMNAPMRTDPNATVAKTCNRSARTPNVRQVGFTAKKM